jgi:hypothetical protein
MTGKTMGYWEMYNTHSTIWLVVFFMAWDKWQYTSLNFSKQFNFKESSPRCHVLWMYSSLLLTPNPLSYAWLNPLVMISWVLYHDWETISSKIWYKSEISSYNWFRTLDKVHCNITVSGETLSAELEPSLYFAI